MSEKLKEFSEQVKEEIDPIVLAELNKRFSGRFREIWDYQMKIGGKRIRPVILIAVALMYGADRKKALLPAAALEIVHNYSLIVDDIIDRSETRRGEKTCWKKFGKTITHCIGVGYAMTFADIVSGLNGKVGGELTSAAKMVTEGEIIDILQERKPNPTESYIRKNKYEEIGMDDYYEMVEKKTSSLIKAACRTGGIIAKAEKDDLDNLEEFGRNIGIAFQIRDDFLDIFGDESEFGKEIGNDIIERKGGNIVILLALQDMKNKDKLLSFLEKKEITPQDIKKIMRIINSTSAARKAEELAKEYIIKAGKALQRFPKNHYRDILEELENYLLIRNK